MGVNNKKIEIKKLNIGKKKLFLHPISVQNWVKSLKRRENDHRQQKQVKCKCLFIKVSVSFEKEQDFACVGHHGFIITNIFREIVSY